jgi:hypothetical protein
MSLRYCSLHGRVFSCAQQRWLAFPRETIREIRGYYDLLCSTTTAPSFLHVLERSCDQCAATFRLIAQRRGSTDGLRPGEEG